MNKDIINATKHILLEIKKAKELGLTKEKKESLIEELIYITDLINSFDKNVLQEYYYFLINLNKNINIFTKEQKIIMEYFISNIVEYIEFRDNDNDLQEEISLEDIIHEQEEDYQEKVKYYQELNARKKEKKLHKRQN